MSHFLRVLKAIDLQSQQQRLEREKQFSLNLSSNIRPSYTLSDKLYMFYVDYVRCGRVKAKWRRMTSGPGDEGGIIRHFALVKTRLLTPGTYANFNLKSIIGFLSGIALTYLFFAFLLITAFDVTTATWVCTLLGPVLSLGLAFSANVRCVTLLVLPQFFSQQGRQILLAYAFLLAATGPAQNTFHNMNILSDSLACTQDQLATASKNIQELISVPFNALSDSMKRVMSSLKDIVQRVKDILLTFKRLVLAIMATIKTAFDWLESSINVCNKKLGTPYERCMRMLGEASDDCKVQVYTPIQWMCDLSYVGAPVCYSVKWIDYLCDFIDWVVNGESIFGVIRAKMREFGRHVKTLFYVSISVKHSYGFETNQSRQYGDVTGGILGEIKARSATLMQLADWASFTSVFILFTLYMLYQVLFYRFRFLHSLTFDNRFITSDLVDIDWRRTLHNRETILPLSRRERSKYVTLLSARMIERERRMFVKSAVFLSVSTFKLVIYLLLDYSLFWVLSIIRTHGRVRTNPRGLTPLSLNVDGEGVVADILKSVIASFKFVGAVMDIDTLPCLPDPVPPDVPRYRQILALIGVTWVIAMLQPFGLRLRHYVMCLYHPDIAKQRSVWLYNHILRKRSSFVKYMRRELRRKFSRSTNVLSASNATRINVKQRLLSWIPFLNYFMRDDVKNACLVCGTFQTEGITLHHCPTPGCIGTYCDECFADLHNVCTICKSPLEYGDLSDVSEEKDSSDDEQAKEQKRHKRQQRKKKLTAKRNQLLSKLKRLKPQRPFKKQTNQEEEIELVLPLYREYRVDATEPHNALNTSDDENKSKYAYPNQAFHSDGDEYSSDEDDDTFYDDSDLPDSDMPAPNDSRDRGFIQPCRVDLTSGDIFEQSLPLCTVDWTRDGTTNRNRGGESRVQDVPPRVDSLEQDTSDDATVRQYFVLNTTGNAIQVPNVDTTHSNDNRRGPNVGKGGPNVDTTHNNDNRHGPNVGIGGPNVGHTNEPNVGLISGPNLGVVRGQKVDVIRGPQVDVTYGPQVDVIHMNQEVTDDTESSKFTIGSEDYTSM
ncbi:hypothetical protein M8J75_011137 [Diaphorina citri]|nr:hypothetical protein M8J75_011137 [Diaphorina citri]